MKLISTLTLSFFLFLSVFGQDAYHQNLNTFLMSTYDLPEATWIVSDTEVDNYNGVISYGCAESNQDIADQDFTKADQVIIAEQGANPWDAGWYVRNTNPIESGDKMLLVFWLRSIGGTGNAKVFVERNSDFAKEVYISIDIDEEWTQYLISFEATTGNYAENAMSLGFHLATQAQTLQIGGLTAINYGTAVSLDDLPSFVNSEEYDGYEADASWRGPANDRIDQFRKANLTIVAEDSNGNPVPDAAFNIEMTQHEFAFGSAVTAARFAGNNSQNATYENKIENLDGNGHGFNWVVFENDMKWNAWEEEWFVTPGELVDAVTWLDDRDIKVRGHTLVWPGFGNLPDDIEANDGDADYIWNRIDDRLNEMLSYPGLEADKVLEWDVLNEIVTNTSLESTFAAVPGNTTGREFYADIFERAKEISPDTKMYINDYMTLTLGNTSGGQYEVLKNRIQEIIDAGAPLEGIGFQGHIGAFPNGIPSVLGTLDDFYESFGLTAKITEFDLPPAVSEELAANYLRDFMTAVFSHESVDGFLFWSFWDGATWQNPGANLFRMDWSRTPAGDMFVDLVFNQWWTDVEKTTNENGSLLQRGFKGKYNITYVCDGEIVTETLNLTEDQTITIICDALMTNNIEINQIPDFSFEAFPNPSNDFIKINRTNNTEAQLIMYNTLGVKVLEQTVSKSEFIIPVDHLKGVYFLELNTDSGKGFQKLIIE